jgi:hypothetical protein
MSEPEKKESSRKPSHYLVLTGIATQMGIIIVAFGYLGKYLDGKYPMDKQWWTIGLTFLGVAIALYLVVKQVNRLNERDK